MVFLARHGRGHRLSPSGIDYRANIDAMKRMGVTDLVSLSACGSFREELIPGLFVLVDQFVDRTHGRISSFFGNGCVAHVSLRPSRRAGPAEPHRRRRRGGSDRRSSRGHLRVHGGATILVAFRIDILQGAQGFDVIGMTNMPEAKLAREAEITYATIAMVTDFDCWHPGHDAVDVASVVAVARANADKAARLMWHASPGTFRNDREDCPAGSHRALDGAIMTHRGPTRSGRCSPSSMRWRDACWPAEHPARPFPFAGKAPSRRRSRPPEFSSAFARCPP